MALSYSSAALFNSAASHAFDACSNNDHFWVFAAATTNVEYTLSVTDTVAGQTRSYTNLAGTLPEPILDFAAFDTCP